MSEINNNNEVIWNIFQPNLPQYYKKFIQFLIRLPSFDNAIFLFSPAEFCRPQKLQKIFPSNRYLQNIAEVVSKQMHISEIDLKDGKQTFCFGMDHQFFKFTNTNQSCKVQYLVLLYLIYKAKNFKILLCFDEVSAFQQNFNNIKTSFNALSMILSPFQKNSKYLQSVGMVLSYNEHDNLKKIFEQQLLNTIKIDNKKFFKQNYDLIDNLSKSIFKNNLVYDINTNMKEIQFTQKRQQFILMIKRMRYYSSQTKKGEKQQINLQLVKIISKKFSTKYPLVNFKNIWQTQYIKFFTYCKQKCNPNKKDKINIGWFIPDCQQMIESCRKKYSLKVDHQPKSILTENISSLKYLSFAGELIKFFLTSKIDENGDENRINEIRKLILLHFKSGILSNDQRFFYYFFQTGKELFEALNKINKRENDLQSCFFLLPQFLHAKIFDLRKSQANPTEYLSFIIKYTTQLLQKDIYKYKKRQYIEILQLEKPLEIFKSISNYNDRRIKKPKLKQQENLQGKFGVQKERLYEYLDELEKIIFLQKLKKQSHIPCKRIKMIYKKLSEIVSQKIELQNKSFFIQIGRSLIQMVKSSYDHSINFQLELLAIKFLSFQGLSTINQIDSFLNFTNTRILRKISKMNSFDEAEEEWLEGYSNYLNKRGLAEKAREIGYKIGQYNQKLSKRILSESALFDKKKTVHVKFIKELYSINKEDPQLQEVSEQFCENMREALVELKQSFQNNKTYYESNHKLQSELLNI